MNKLISLCKSSVIIVLVSFTSQAFAEYYVVYSAPSVVVCNTCQTPQRVIKHYPKKVIKHYSKKCHRSHHAYTKPYKRSSYSISVYYPITSCSYCNACTSCAGYSYREKYIERVRTYTTYDEYEFDFDYDRRTADDVGSDMNIDY